MFVLTAKLDRKKIAIALLLLAAAICAVVILIVGRGAEPSAGAPSVKNNKARIEYLSSFGWIVDEEPIQVQSIVIPREFSGVYEQYNTLQQEQGFDLGKFAGMEATRYTYAVRNYPGLREEIVADIVVCRGKVIAGDVQSTAMDGFMHGLDYPG